MLRPVAVVIASLLVLAAGAGEQPLDHDVVHLANGHSLHGTVRQVPDDGDSRLLLQTENGLIGLDGSQVEGWELGYASRLRFLDREDPDGHVELARWCLDHGLKQEAYTLLARAVALGSEDAWVAGKLALLTDELRDYESALPLYLRYRDELGGEDPVILARIEEIEAALARYQEAVEEAMAQAKQESRKEGMETRGWLKENPQYSNPIEHSVVEVGEGLVTNKVLRLEFGGGTEHKAVIRRRISLDGTELGPLVFYVHNPGRSTVPLSLAVKTGEKWDYFESRPVSVRPSGNGYVRVEFRFDSRDYKSDASNWTHNTPVRNLEDIRELQIQVHNGDRDGELFIDGLGFVEETE